MQKRYSCNGCKHALWDRRNDGKLHPSGAGTCMYKVEKVRPKLPRALYVLYDTIIGGGRIGRRNKFIIDCDFYEGEE